MRTTVISPGAREESQVVAVGSRQWFSFLVNYIALPNVPFLAARYFLYIDRALLNLDYLVLGLIAPFLSRTLNLTLFTGLLICDIFFSLSGVYHFPAADALRALRELPKLSFGAVILVVVIALAPCVIWIRTAFICGRRFKSLTQWYVPVAFLLAFGLADTGIAILGKAYGRELLPDGFARSSMWTVGRSTADDFIQVTVKPFEFWRKPSASAQLLPDVVQESGAGQENVVLIIVESLGVPANEHLLEMVIAPMESAPIKRRYDVRTGFVPFYGSTVWAEFRELCGIGMGLKGVSLNKDDFSECLPNRFAHSGYDTVAIHGFRESMFRRNHWYAEIGFRRSIFLENWPTALRGTCGSQFQGVCDRDAAQVVRRELIAHEGQRKLIYWLTLDSHLQTADDFVRRSPVQADDFPPGTPHDVRFLFARLQNVMVDIADVASDTKIAPTHFIIVGDHAPPFMLQSKRNLFSQTAVPYVELAPRMQTRRQGKAVATRGKPRRHLEHGIPGVKRI